MTSTLIQRGLDFLLPQDCLLCGASSKNVLLCGACDANLPRLPEKHCPRCAIPTPHGEICGRCLAHPTHYERTYAVFLYEFPVDRLIGAFKYGHRLSLAAYFGRQMATVFQAVNADIDVLIPLPLHPSRLKERGFNQALELARTVAKTLNKPLDTKICRRTRATKPQVELRGAERLKNLRGAFACDADLRGKNVLLVDDVMTSGASVNECSRSLKARGAADITLLVLARAAHK